VYSTTRIRNVALVGHGGTGKTSLAEALLHRAGATKRLGRVDDGTACCDFEPEERERHLSLSLAMAPFVWRDHKINLIDTPGYADFLGEVEAALRVADLAVVVVSAADGVQVQTRAVWRMAEEMGLPRLIFVNKLDRDRADLDATLIQLSNELGGRLAPLELPIGREASFTGVADLLTDRAYLHEGEEFREATVPEDLVPLEQESHETLVESIVETDDLLLERYLEGTEPDTEELERTLHQGIMTGDVVPVLLGSATQEIGIDRLADYLVEIGPSPLEHPLTVAGGDQEIDIRADENGEPLAFVFKTIADPFVGQLSLFRVLSGTIRTDDHLINSRTATDERLHGLFALRGRDQEPVTQLAAGDLGAVAKLDTTRTGDTLAPRGSPVSAPPIEGPPPTYALAVEPRTQADEDKLAPALHRLEDEDPSLRVERNDETGQTLLWGTGETHLQITLQKLTRKFGAEVETRDIRVPYRETISRPVTGVEGRHKKQTGGHGQFGVCVLDVEPLDRGGGFVFESSVVGGAISRGHIPAVEKGVSEAMASGGVFGYPVVDVKVTLTDGKEHSVDSSEMAFKTAGRIAFREALDRAGPVLLEPVGRVEVTVPNELQGDVLGDLNARRGRVQGAEPADEHSTTIVALVPEAEMTRYTIDLRSVTGGRGQFRLTHDHYDVMPSHLAEAVRRNGS
jgi:elongation factor G